MEDRPAEGSLTVRALKIARERRKRAGISTLNDRSSRREGFKIY